jgi:hypothetical protein
MLKCLETRHHQDVLGRYFTVVDLLPLPERVSFQDWMVCRKS